MPGPRGVSREQMRNGASAVRSEERTALGIIFHDAEQPYDVVMGIARASGFASGSFGSVTVSTPCR